ncbi:unnamed protein product [Discosporangium mesarthrocarpum]
MELHLTHSMVDKYLSGVSSLISPESRSFTCDPGSTTPMNLVQPHVMCPVIGNNWLRFLLAHTWLYNQPGDANWYREYDFNLIEDAIPDLEYGPNRYKYPFHEPFRAFKSHQPFTLNALPGKCAETVGTMEDFQCACPNCPAKWTRILHLVRDGRDVMCSYYHFRKGLGTLEPYNMSFEDFLEADIYPGFKWADHVASYLRLQGNETFDVLTIKYEDLHENPREVLTEVAKWVGLGHREEVITRAVEMSSFKRMRQKEETAGLRLFDQQYPHRDSRWRLTRKGQAGGWRECFTTQAAKDKWNELALDVMYDLGYIDSVDW